MKKKIFKYEIPANGEVLMPIGAEVLSIQMTLRSLCLWAIVTPGAPNELRQFTCYGTGDELYRNSDNEKYITTYQNLDMVWHVFENLNYNR